MRSRILERTEVFEIGLKSEGVVGESILALGRMEVDFHCLGTIDVDNDRSIKAARGAEKNVLSLINEHIFAQRSIDSLPDSSQ